MQHTKRYTNGGLVGEELYGRLREYLRDGEPVPCPERKYAALRVDAGDSAGYHLYPPDAWFGGKRRASEIWRTCDEEDL